MKRLRCAKCEITAAESWAWIWHRSTFEVDGPAGKKTVERWLCPDCAGEFATERSRKAFLRRSVGK